MYLWEGDYYPIEKISNLNGFVNKVVSRIFTLDNSPVIDSNRVLLNGYDAVVY
jgi:hypothetical protein